VKVLKAGHIEKPEYPRSPGCPAALLPQGRQSDAYSHTAFSQLEWERLTIIPIYIIIIFMPKSCRDMIDAGNQDERCPPTTRSSHHHLISFDTARR